MLEPVGRHLSHTTVVSYLALFVALATGGAYAANELIGPDDIADNAVLSKHIKRANVKNADIADNAVTSAKVADGSLLGEDFDAGQLPAGAQGPKGDAGAVGAQGPTGDTGQQGPPGPSTGPAGGDLTGTFPNPTLANGSIDSSNLFVAGLVDGVAANPTLRSLGTTGSQAAAGNDPRLSDSRTPSGPAGGDLTGTYPNPTIANGAVTESKLGCGSDPNQVMVKVGSVCIDRYENSIWDAPTGGSQIIGAIPCNPNGQNCTNIYARSVAGVVPRAGITWFQAQQALANSGKQLPTNAEWQMAVAGTPDSAACNVSTDLVANTGANNGCVSVHGANDMVGNLSEWVGDWVPATTDCPGWAAFSNDEMCLSGASTTTTGPAALVRGGNFVIVGSNAGPFAIFGFQPPFPSSVVGFRGVR